MWHQPREFKSAPRGFVVITHILWPWDLVQTSPLKITQYIYSITSKHNVSNKSPLQHVKLKKHHTENMLLHGNVLLLLLLLLRCICGKAVVLFVGCFHAVLMKSECFPSSSSLSLFAFLSIFLPSISSSQASLNRCVWCMCVVSRPSWWTGSRAPVYSLDPGKHKSASGTKS